MDNSTNGTFIRSGSPGSKWTKLDKSQATPLPENWEIRLSAPMQAKISPLEYRLVSYTHPAESNGDQETVLARKSSKKATPQANNNAGSPPAAKVASPGSGAVGKSNHKRARSGFEERLENVATHPAPAANHENQDAIDRLLEFQADNAQLREKLGAEQNKVATLERKIKAVKEFSAALEKRAAEAEAREATAQAAVVAAQKHAEELEGELDAARESHAEIENARQGTLQKASEFEMRLGQKEVELQGALTRIEQLESDLHNAEALNNEEKSRADAAEAKAYAAEAALRSKEASQMAIREELEKAGGFETRYETAAAEAANLRSELIQRDAALEEEKRKNQDLSLREAGARERERLTRLVLSDMQRLAQQSAARAQAGARRMAEEQRAAEDMAKQIEKRIEQAAALGGGLVGSPARLTPGRPGVRAYVGSPGPAVPASTAPQTDPRSTGGTAAGNSSTPLVLGQTQTLTHGEEALTLTTGGGGGGGGTEELQRIATVEEDAGGEEEGQGGDAEGRLAVAETQPANFIGMLGPRESGSEEGEEEEEEEEEQVLQQGDVEEGRAVGGSAGAGGAAGGIQVAPQVHGAEAVGINDSEDEGEGDRPTQDAADADDVIEVIPQNISGSGTAAAPGGTGGGGAGNAVAPEGGLPAERKEDAGVVEIDLMDEDDDEVVEAVAGGTIGGTGTGTGGVVRGLESDFVIVGDADDEVIVEDDDDDDEEIMEESGSGDEEPEEEMAEEDDDDEDAF